MAVHDSPVLKYLTTKTDIEIEGLTVQAVEIVLASLVKVCSSMLVDDLVHGLSEGLVDQLASAPKTLNVSCERDLKSEDLKANRIEQGTCSSSLNLLLLCIF